MSHGLISWCVTEQFYRNSSPPRPRLRRPFLGGWEWTRSLRRRARRPDDLLPLFVLALDELAKCRGRAADGIGSLAHHLPFDRRHREDFIDGFVEPGDHRFGGALGREQPEP